MKKPMINVIERLIKILMYFYGAFTMASFAQGEINFPKLLYEIINIIQYINNAIWSNLLFFIPYFGIKVPQALYDYLTLNTIFMMAVVVSLIDVYHSAPFQCAIRSYIIVERLKRLINAAFEKYEEIDKNYEDMDVEVPSYASLSRLNRHFIRARKSLPIISLYILLSIFIFAPLVLAFEVEVRRIIFYIRRRMNSDSVRVIFDYVGKERWSFITNIDGNDDRDGFLELFNIFIYALGKIIFIFAVIIAIALGYTRSII